MAFCLPDSLRLLFPRFFLLLLFNSSTSITESSKVSSCFSIFTSSYILTFFVTSIASILVFLFVSSVSTPLSINSSNFLLFVSLISFLMLLIVVLLLALSLDGDGVLFLLDFLSFLSLVESLECSALFWPLVFSFLMPLETVSLWFTLLLVSFLLIAKSFVSIPALCLLQFCSSSSILSSSSKVFSNSSSELIAVSVFLVVFLTIGSVLFIASFPNRSVVFTSFRAGLDFLLLDSVLDFFDLKS